MKVFKRYWHAKAAADGKPIIAIRGGGKGDVYVVVEGDLLDVKLTQIELISGTGAITAQVGLGHLDRLGNANHALPAPWPRGDNNRCFKSALGKD